MILVCLYHKFTKVIWRKNDVITWGQYAITNRKTKQKSHFINDYNEFVLNDLKLGDSGIYKCYSSSKLLATIELEVVSKLLKPLDVRQDNYDFYMKYVLSLMGVCSLLVLYYVFMKFLNTLIISEKMRMNKEN